MAETVTLALPQPTERLAYPIVIGSGILSQINSYFDLKNYSKAHVLYDANLEKSLALINFTDWGINVTSSAIAGGESAKSLSTLEQILQVFSVNKLDRQSLIINLGGGMLGDLGGFAASIYMRGIDFIQVPTTLLAQVDASVGGKVAINFNGIKNLLGSFQQPKLVLIDVATLSTLPRRELNSGFAEIVKHALIYDIDFVSALESLDPRALSEESLVALIKKNCLIKAAIVAQDPHEKGLRKILNFGHTIGHAIESLSAKSISPLLHGECVALGMLAEAHIALQRGALTNSDVKRIKELLLHFDLPTKLTHAISSEQALDIITHDKKNSSGKILCALVQKLGSCSAVVEVTASELHHAIQSLEIF
jgi:3-dehydroquinate synthase